MGVDDSYDGVPDSIAHFLRHGDACVDLVEPVVRFLQGQDPTLALRIASGNYLPEGPRFAPLRSQTQEGCVASAPNTLADGCDVDY